MYMREQFAAKFLADEAAAEADKLTADQIAPVLADHRDGDKQATAKLLRGLTYLVFAACRYERKAAKKGRNRERDDTFSTLYLDLATQVERLRENDEPASGVVQYIKNELKWSDEHYLAKEISKEESRLERVDNRTGRMSEQGEVIEDPTAPNYRRQFLHDEPLSPLDDLIDTEERQFQMAELERAERYCKTPLERNVIGLRLAGMSVSDIAKSLHLKSDHVIRLILGVQSRASINKW